MPPTNITCTVGMYIGSCIMFKKDCYYNNLFAVATLHLFTTLHGFMPTSQDSPLGRVSTTLSDSIRSGGSRGGNRNFSFFSIQLQLNRPPNPPTPIHTHLPPSLECQSPSPLALSYRSAELIRIYLTLTSHILNII